MKQKTKLMLTFVSLCLVITLGIIGIFAVKTLNMSVGGNITFSASGLNFTVSDGSFKDENNNAYQNITTQTNVVKGFTMNTDTTEDSIKSKLDTWTSLNLVLNQQGDAYLQFTVTNNTQGKNLGVEIVVSKLGTNKNNNMKIVAEGDNVSYGSPKLFNIKFDIIDTNINAGLTGFEIKIVFSEDVVQASVSAGEISNESALTNASAKMQAVKVTEKDNGQASLQTWSDLDITMPNDGSNVEITFAVTNFRNDKYLRIKVINPEQNGTNCKKTISSENQVNKFNTYLPPNSGEDSSTQFTALFETIDTTQAASFLDCSIQIELSFVDDLPTAKNISWNVGGFRIPFVKLDNNEYLQAPGYGEPLTGSGQARYSLIFGYRPYPLDDPTHPLVLVSDDPTQYTTAPQEVMWQIEVMVGAETRYYMGTMYYFDLCDMTEDIKILKISMFD